MPLVNAKCTNCGANLEVDNLKDAAICPYCNTAYVTEKAIKNYNVTNTIYTEQLNIINNSSNNEAESLFEKARGFSKIERYEDSIKLYIKLCNENPGEYKYWKGFLDNYFLFIKNTNNLPQTENCLKDLIKNVRLLCPEDEIKSLDNDINHICEDLAMKIKKGDLSIILLLNYKFPDVIQMKFNDNKYLKLNPLDEIKSLHSSFQRVVDEGTQIANRIKQMGLYFDTYRKRLYRKKSDLYDEEILYMLNREVITKGENLYTLYNVDFISGYDESFFKQVFEVTSKEAHKKNKNI